jgi:hypothetical protein
MINHYVYPYELRHHGILGMKWGVRRKRGSNGLVGGGLGSARRALNEAKARGQDAANASLKRARASEDHGRAGSARRALNEANSERRAAARDSLIKSKEAAGVKPNRLRDSLVPAFAKTAAMDRQIAIGNDVVATMLVSRFGKKKISSAR